MIDSEYQDIEHHAFIKLISLKDKESIFQHILCLHSSGRKIRNRQTEKSNGSNWPDPEQSPGLTKGSLHTCMIIIFPMLCEVREPVKTRADA